MKINVSGIPEEGLQQEIDLPVVINDSKKTYTVHVFVKAVKFGTRVLIEGSVKVTAEFKCSRCLKEYSLPLALSFQEEYVPAEEVGKEKHELELSNDELDVSFYSNDEIDIEDMIREQVLLAVPMKPLCSEECRGLCPVCGINLNEGACACGKKEIDPRLAPLEKFKELLKTRKE
ncbi:MAG: DUF177 domain-containing protein [Nitrospirae bacterium]|nr:DUF177 domain-containing protein [Nitrospirota bacterium]